MDHKAQLLKTVPTMEGWCDPAKANHVFDMVYSQNANVCVELGVFAGRSLVAFALALAKRHEGDPSGTRVIHGVDTWCAGPAMENNEPANKDWWRKLDYDYIKRECQRVVNELGVNEFVRLHHTSTIQAYYDIEGEIDVLHIDGNHSRWDSTRDVTMWVDRVRPGGVVYFDDEDWDSTANARELILEKCKEIGKIRTTNVCGVYRKFGGGKD